MTYEELLKDILENGLKREDRTGTGTLSVFGRQMRFDLSSYPLITTKRVWFKGIVYELLWFLKGSTNVKWLKDNGVHIWDEWADSHGNLGPVYGKQWRAWVDTAGIIHDQIAQALDMIKNDPYSRRIIVSAWNVGDLKKMALPPCHVLFQFYVNNGKLSCQLYQRSCDMFLGVPFNIAEYSLLTMMMAQQANLEPGEFVWTGGDCHIYLNHIDQVKEEISRDPYPFPTLTIDKADSIFSYKYEDMHLNNYQHHPAIHGDVAV